MRKHQQKQVLELIKTMNEAYAEIKRLFSRKEYDAVVQLLSDCQDFAVKIGSYIESIEGEGTRTVTLLEECHEALYQAGSELSGANPDGSMIKRLREMFLKIESSVHNELKPDKIEVVFLPYKAAMWDSLESIYLAAKADPYCDAYVVPIPYYDRMNDGTLGQMHYEGDQYPAYIPITDWEAYDIEARHPDIIFIHNPYDGGNHVTTIHAGYYSKRLKNFTDLLVYVPYFVCVDDVPEHLCVNAGTLLADKVIVQSEKIRQTYIRVLMEYEKKNHCAGKFGNIENRFAAFGSPKLDWIHHSKPEDFILPDDWQGLIDRARGSQKKIILYNTSVESILRGEEAYLKKIRCVLDTFRKRRDVVLWWRPHPLSEATYQSMRPQFLAEYRQIVAEYKGIEEVNCDRDSEKGHISEGKKNKQPWGIYDDSPDLHRAIASSDAYYGDMSSVVALYQAMGKPSVLQDIDKNYENLFPNGKLPFLSCAEREGRIWFAGGFTNDLFCADVNSGEAKLVANLSDKKTFGFGYSGIHFCNNKLFIIPSTEDNIIVYDIAACEFSVVELRKPGVKVPQSAIKFFSSVKHKNHIYCFPFHYDAIVRIDTTNHKVDYLTDFYKEHSSRFTFEEYSLGIFRKGGCTIGNCQYIPSRSVNALFVLNMENFTGEWISIGQDGDGLAESIAIDNHVWTRVVRNINGIPDKTHWIKMDIKTAQWDYIQIPGLGLYSGFTLEREGVLFIDNADEGFVKYNTNDGSLSLVKVDKNIVSDKFKRTTGVFTQAYNTIHTDMGDYFLRVCDNQLYRIGGDLNLVPYGNPIHYSDAVNTQNYGAYWIDHVRAVWGYFEDYQGLLGETDMVNTVDLIKYFVDYSKEYRTNSKPVEKGNAGTKIYEYASKKAMS